MRRSDAVMSSDKVFRRGARRAGRRGGTENIFSPRAAHKSLKRLDSVERIQRIPRKSNRPKSGNPRSYEARPRRAKQIQTPPQPGGVQRSGAAPSRAAVAASQRLRPTRRSPPREAPSQPRAGRGAFPSDLWERVPPDRRAPSRPHDAQQVAHRPATARQSFRACACERAQIAVHERRHQLRSFGVVAARDGPRVAGLIHNHPFPALPRAGQIPHCPRHVRTP